MSLPASGKVHSDLQVNRSKSNPALAFGSVTVTGSIEIDVGTFAPYGEAITSETVASFGAAPSANANYVYVTAGSLPNTRKIVVLKSDFTVSTTAVLIKFVTVIGSRVGK